VFILCYCAGHITDSDNTGGCMVDVRILYKNVLGKGGGRSHLRDHCVGVSIILRWILEMWDVRLGPGSMWLCFCVNMRLYGYSNEPLFSVENGEFLDQLSDC
jgi:hypothetical protein